MTLVLARGHRHARALAARDIRVRAQGETSDARALHVGVVNLMPKAEDYELLLLTALGRALKLTRDAVTLVPHFIRLESHVYASSDVDVLRAYQTYESALAGTPLAGLIVTGAPVEELAFEDVRYWPELCTLLTHAREHVPSTLGVCWGGMALAELLGVPKVTFTRKLFGVYPLRGEYGDEQCAQSRHAGVDEQALASAVQRGAVTELARGELTGATVIASADRRFVAHLGHPEYDVARLRFEYERDRVLGRADVSAPYGVDLRHPERSAATHGPLFFARWLASLGGR